MISIIIPIYNEEEVIPELITQLEIVLPKIEDACEVVFINDGSTDRSLFLLKNIIPSFKYRVINFSRNFGHQAAISAGLDTANGEAVIMLDADLQDPPELIIEFIRKWKEGYEVVYGIREIRDGETIFKKLSASIFYLLIGKLSGIKIPAQAGDFRLLDKKVINNLRALKERNKFLRGMISWVGYKQIGLKYNRNPRFAGKTKYSLAKMFRLAFDAICSFSITPLRISTYSGFIVAFFSFVFLIITLIEKYVFKATIQGWTSLIIAILFLGSIQLVTVGILGEYIGRIYEEVKNRPPYIIDEITDRDHT